MNLSFCWVSIVSIISGFTQAARADLKEDIEVFQRGEVMTWKSTENPRAKGIDLKFCYPRSWAIVNSDDPNTVQRFRSEAGTGWEEISIRIIPLPAPYNRAASKVERTAILSIETLSKILSRKFNYHDTQSHQIGELDGEVCATIPNGAAIPTPKPNLPGGTVLREGMSHYIPRNGVLLIIDYSTGQWNWKGGRALLGRYRAAEPLFRLIASSCDFLDKP